MEGFSNNGECVLQYLALFQDLSLPERDGGACQEAWRALREREAATPQSVPLAPPLLQERFALPERQFLLVMAALALELDGGLRGAFRKRYGLNLPTVEYGLQLLEPLCPAGVEVLAELAGKTTLTGLLLSPSQEESPERPLVLCRGVLAFLTGFAPAAVRGVTLRIGSGEDCLPLHQEALEEIRAWFAWGGGPLYLSAPEGAGRRTLLRRACGGAAIVDLEEIGGLSSPERERLLREAAVAARLALVPVCAAGCEGREEALRELETLCRDWPVPLAVLTEEDRGLLRAREVLRLRGTLTPAEREAAWRRFLPGAEADSCPQGAMTVGALRETANLAGRYAAGPVGKEDVQKAVRRRSGTVEFAVRRGVSASLEDLVLPEDVRERLERICQAAEYGGQLAAWGLPQTREGVTAVFHGPSGTGKTMAAGAIAGRLGLPLLRADLSQIMDKYVGETEKHLARLLRCARENRCVLFFDEADALFSKRAEIAGGHDKYANLSTSYLLQEIEGYEGVALLSTNLLSNFDEAFLRRLHYIVRFPLPDAAARETLWRRALPPGRIRGDVPYELLSQAELSPARINGAARAAALEAAAAGRDRVDAWGLIRAAALELEKNGRSLPGGLREWLEKGGQGDGT